MVIDKDDKLLAKALDSKCVICGKDIGFQLYECSEKDRKKYFAHYLCLKPKRKRG